MRVSKQFRQKRLVALRAEMRENTLACQQPGNAVFQVKRLAEDEIARLDRVIAAELRRAETRKEMRIRDYDDDDGKSDDDLGKEGEPVVR